MNTSMVKSLENEILVLKFHRAKFIILLALQIPAIFTSLFIFAFFMTHRAHMKRLQNQALVVLLITNFFLISADLPMPIHFYRLGYISPASAIYCTWWTFFEYSLNLTSELLMAVISLQRHILVFQAQLLRVSFRRWILYYVPLLFCLIYPFIFYLIIIVFYPCDGSQWDFQSNLCGYADCYLVDNRILSTFDWGVNNGLPILVIFLANLTLIIRVVKQKRRVRQVSRKKQRRLTLQLLRISSLYLVAWLPSLFIGLSQQLISPDFMAQIQSDYALDLIYLVCLVLPWICLKLLPEVTKWMWKLLKHNRVTCNAIRPM